MIMGKKKLVLCLISIGCVLLLCLTAAWYAFCLKHVHLPDALEISDDIFVHLQSLCVVSQESVRWEFLSILNGMDIRGGNTELFCQFFDAQSFCYPQKVEDVRITFCFGHSKVPHHKMAIEYIAELYDHFHEAFILIFSFKIH